MFQACSSGKSSRSQSADPLGNKVFLPPLGLPNFRFMCQQQTSVYWKIFACTISPMPGHQTHHHILLGRPKLRDRRVLVGSLAEQEPHALSQTTTRVDHHGGIFPEEMATLTITEAPSRKQWPVWGYEILTCKVTIQQNTQCVFARCFC